jgi:hypothetical protein
MTWAALIIDREEHEEEEEVALGDRTGYQYHITQNTLPIRSLPGDDARRGVRCIPIRYGRNRQFG